MALVELERKTTHTLYFSCRMAKLPFPSSTTSHTRLGAAVRGDFRVSIRNDRLLEPPRLRTSLSRQDQEQDTSLALSRLARQSLEGGRRDDL